MEGRRYQKGPASAFSFGLLTPHRLLSTTLTTGTRPHVSSSQLHERDYRKNSLAYRSHITERPFNLFLSPTADQCLIVSHASSNVRSREKKQWI
jgi:hypothetical protein